MSSLPGPEILADLFNGEQSFFSIHQIALKFSHLFIFCVCWRWEGVEVENNLWELVLSLQCVGSGDQTLVICLGGAHHCPLLRISGPKRFTFNLLQSFEAPHKTATKIRR